MAEKSPKVQCVFCNQGYTSKGLVRHFLACGEKKLRDEAETELMKKVRNIRASDNKRVFLIKVFCPYEPEYWLIIEVNANTTLKKLDGFLRGIWLECCGHLSSFDIEGMRYDSDTTSYFGERPQSMNIQLGKVLADGLQVDYEYDFGSTTHLKLKVAAERMGQLPKKPIKLLARNSEPVYGCAQCNEQKATLVCPQCMEPHCESCAKEHECYGEICDEDMFLPLVNSPRTGVCGYTG